MFVNFQNLKKLLKEKKTTSEGIFDRFWLHFGAHFESKRHQKSKLKFNKKKEPIFERIFLILDFFRLLRLASRKQPRDFRIDHNQYNSGNLNTASARGAPDLIASRIPPGLGLASGACRIASLLRRIGWHGVIGFSMDVDAYS